MRRILKILMVVGSHSVLASNSNFKCEFTGSDGFQRNSQSFSVDLKGLCDEQMSVPFNLGSTEYRIDFSCAHNQPSLLKYHADVMKRVSPESLEIVAGTVFSSKGLFLHFLNNGYFD